MSVKQPRTRKFIGLHHHRRDEPAVSSMVRRRELLGCLAGERWFNAWHATEFCRS
jgi:hypothetical protein